MERLLIPGEHVVLRIGQNGLRTTQVIFLAVIGVLLTPITFGISLLFSVFLLAQLLGMKRVITNLRVIEQRGGLLGRRLQEMALRDIQAVEINRSPLRWSTVRVFSSGGRKIALDYVHAPEQVKTTIDQLRLGQSTPPPIQDQTNTAQPPATNLANSTQARDWRGAFVSGAQSVGLVVLAAVLGGLSWPWSLVGVAPLVFAAVPLWKLRGHLHIRGQGDVFLGIAVLLLCVLPVVGTLERSYWIANPPTPPAPAIDATPRLARSPVSRQPLTSPPIHEVAVRRDEFEAAGKVWPFEPASGTVGCGGPLSALWYQAPSGRRYALNGTANAHMSLPWPNEIWLQDRVVAEAIQREFGYWPSPEESGRLSTSDIMEAARGTCR